MAFLEEQILGEISRIVEIAKPFINNHGERDGQIKPDKDGKLPEFYPGYNTLVKFYKEILVHAEKGIFPDKLFKERSPNETKEEFEYRMMNYQQVTLPIFLDYVATVTRPFAPGNWSIEYKETEAKFGDETFQKYVEEKIKDWVSIENFVKNTMPTLKSKDAEGVIAVKPSRMVTKEVNGETVIDSTVLPEPIPVYYTVKQVVSFKKDEFALILLNEKSVVTEGKRPMRAGLVFEFYDRQNIWRITQIGRRIDFNFEIELLFNHEWNRLPVSKLMGIPTILKGLIFNHSPFLFAVPNLDLVSLDESNLLVAKNKSAYPTRVMVGTPCEFENEKGACDNGSFILTNGEGTVTCPNCQGSGLMSRTSPFTDYLVKPKTRDDDGDTGIADPFKYVAPDTGILNFLRQEIEKNKAKARQILHLRTSNTTVQGQEDMTATVAAIDVKSMNAFINLVSDQMFNLYEGILEAIGWMRYRSEDRLYSLTRPTTFDFRSEEDFIAQLSVAVSAGVPPLVVREMLLKYLRTIYFSDQQVAEAFDVLIEADRFLDTSNDQIALKLARGTAAKWEDVLHCSGATLIRELVLEDENYFDLEMSEKVTKLQDKAKEKVAEIQTTQSPVNIPPVIPPTEVEEEAAADEIIEEEAAEPEPEEEV
jgi:hypothetical protein